MDYEKLYKDTIAKLQEMVNSGEITVEVAREICADFIPESEDERIRKGIIRCVKGNMPDNDFRKKYIAWLERQKERSPLSKDEEYTLARIIEYLENNDCPSEWKDLLHDVYALPYQKEQKPSWGEEDKYMLNNIIDTLKPLSQTTHSGYAINSMINWLKFLRPQNTWKPSDA